jgi:hypothetical protein
MDDKGRDLLLSGAKKRPFIATGKDARMRKQAIKYVEKSKGRKEKDFTSQDWGLVTNITKSMKSKYKGKGLPKKYPKKEVGKKYMKKKRAANESVLGKFNNLMEMMVVALPMLGKYPNDKVDHGYSDDVMHPVFDDEMSNDLGPTAYEMLTKEMHEEAQELLDNLASYGYVTEEQKAKLHGCVNEAMRELEHKITERCPEIKDLRIDKHMVDHID